MYFGILSFGILLVYFFLSFFLSARLNGLPLSEILSIENIKSSLKWDLPVLLIALVLAGIAMKEK